MRPLGVARCQVQGTFMCQIRVQRAKDVSRRNVLRMGKDPRYFVLWEGLIVATSLQQDETHCRESLVFVLLS